MSSDEPEKARATGEAEDGTGAAGTGVPGTADTEDTATADVGTADVEAAGVDVAESPDADSASDGTESADAASDTDATGTDADDGTAEPGADDSDDDSTDGERRSGPPRWALLGAAAFATAAFVVAAVFGVWWLVSATGDDAEIAAERQDVTRVAGQAVTAFTELDHTKLDEYFSRQKELATGELANQISQAEKTYREAITKAKSKVTTTVHDVAVSELNDREGKASAIVAASADIKRGQQQGMKTMRLEVQLTRDGEDGPWKVSQIGDVPVTGGGQQ
ncbi:hypothetical protein LY13_001768 [Prauserella aidingensis]|uniref:hypothetical protein n=1 Tax=Prauserella aidingensis TaxID=387890 RepID=UPI0020A4EE1E|nr:hypothetical protein [Prauserella aidingensis]MCP2253024.1 hypothetical protein [Prauserella aidingensis]